MEHTQLINYLIRQRKARRYLQLGVIEERYDFRHIQCAGKTGVDPKPVTTFRGSPDEFFARCRQQFDVIFIDSFHTEEQAARDIAHSLEHLAKDGIIVIHDCMPPDAWHQREPEAFREGENWNGTVWKAVLRAFNRSLYRCTLLDTDWGCGLIDTAESQFPKCVELPGELHYDLHYPLLLGYKTSVAAYLRDQVKIFYHLACMGNWHTVFGEQLQQLRRSGFTEIRLTVLGTADDLQVAEALCNEMKVAYTILYHSPELTQFEKPAMLAIEKYARLNEGYVLYLHSKGVSNPADGNKAKWRRLMMRALVEEWEYCVTRLPDYDAIGVNWRRMPPVSHFSGNFWYASTQYLRKLANFERYYENPRYRIGDPINHKRLGCEFWIGSAPVAPRVLSLVYSNVDFCAAGFWENKQLL